MNAMDVRLRCATHSATDHRVASFRLLARSGDNRSANRCRRSCVSFEFPDETAQLTLHERPIYRRVLGSRGMRRTTSYGSTVVKSGIGFGTALAIAISWSQHHSLLWAVIHGFFSWLYVVYFALTR